MSFINEAFAAGSTTTGGAHAQGSGISSILILVVFVAFIYFFIWRPQSKRNKAQRELVNSVKMGSEVVTAGGVFGTVRSVSDNFFEVEVAEGILIKFQRSSVSHVLPKGTLGKKEEANTKNDSVSEEATATAE